MKRKRIIIAVLAGLTVLLCCLLISGCWNRENEPKDEVLTTGSERKNEIASGEIPEIREHEKVPSEQEALENEGSGFKESADETTEGEASEDKNAGNEASKGTQEKNEKPENKAAESEGTENAASEDMTAEPEAPESVEEESKAPESVAVEPEVPESVEEESEAPESAAAEPEEPESSTAKQESTVHTCTFTTMETAATCLESGQIQEICTECKQVGSSRETAALGHDFKRSIWESATCLKGGYYNNTCKRCGLVECVTEAALPHEPEEVVVQEGNCMEDTIIRHICKNCGQQTESDTRYTPQVHDWVQGIVDGAEITYCAMCGVVQ